MGSTKEEPKLSAAHCNRCGATIYWLKTEKGANMPVNTRIQVVVTDDGKTVRGRTPHWATCPFAPEFRNKK